MSFWSKSFLKKKIGNRKTLKQVVVVGLGVRRAGAPGAQAGIGGLVLEMQTPRSPSRARPSVGASPQDSSPGRKRPKHQDACNLDVSAAAQLLAGLRHHLQSAAAAARTDEVQRHATQELLRKTRAAAELGPAAPAGSERAVTITSAAHTKLMSVLPSWLLREAPEPEAEDPRIQELETKVSELRKCANPSLRFTCLTSTCWPHFPATPYTSPAADLTRLWVRKRCLSPESAEEVSEFRKCANPSLRFAPHLSLSQFYLSPSLSSTVHFTVLAGKERSVLPLWCLRAEPHRPDHCQPLGYPATSPAEQSLGDATQDCARGEVCERSATRQRRRALAPAGPRSKPGSYGSFVFVRCARGVCPGKASSVCGTCGMPLLAVGCLQAASKQRLPGSSSR